MRGGEGDGERRIRSHGLFDRRAEKRDGAMESKIVKLWYDPEGDYLEVLFEKKAGYFRATENDRVMEKIDKDGNILGFSVMKVSSLKKEPLEVSLT